MVFLSPETRLALPEQTGSPVGASSDQPSGGATGSGVASQTVSTADQVSSSPEQAGPVLADHTPPHILDAAEQPGANPGKKAPPAVQVPAGVLAGWWVAALFIAAMLASLIQIVGQRTDRGFFLLCLSFCVVAGAALFDVATRRVPNLLTYPALLLGLGLNLVLGTVLSFTGPKVALLWLGSSVSTGGASDAFFGFALCAVIGIVSFMARGLGGGDVKLLAAVGAMLGLDAMVPVLFNTLFIAAVIGVANLAFRGELMARAQGLMINVLTYIVTQGRDRNIYPFRKTEAPFVLSLLLAMALSQFVALHEVAWHQLTSLAKQYAIASLPPCPSCPS